MTCPWDSFAHESSRFCEESLCSWVRQPANTWSNVGFLLVGILILRFAAQGRSRHLRALGWISIATALGSAFYHASETLIGRVADYAGMYLGASFMLAVNVARLLRGRAPRLAHGLFWASFAGPMALMLKDEQLATAVYIGETAFCCVALELVLFIQQGKTTRYRFLVFYWLLFGVAYALWCLDVKGFLCDPKSHLLNGHAAWHLLDAAALFVLYRYYEQFQALRPVDSRAAAPLPDGGTS